MSWKKQAVLGVGITGGTALGLSILVSLSVCVNQSNSAVVPVVIPSAVIDVPPSISVGAHLVPSVVTPSRHQVEGRIEQTVNVDDDWKDFYDKGQSLYREGKYEGAYKLWKSSLALAEKDKVWEKASGVESIEILKKLAMMHKTASEPAKATEKYNLAISTAIKASGAESKLVADLMLEQGRMYTFYEQVKNESNANEFLNEAFRINVKLYGRFTIPTGDVAMAIAQLKEQQKNFEEALAYWQLVIDIGDRLEPNTISCCRIGPRQGKARCLEALAKYDHAIAAHKDLIGMCKAGAPGMMTTVVNAYASCLRKCGRDGEADAVMAQGSGR